MELEYEKLRADLKSIAGIDGSKYFCEVSIHSQNYENEPWMEGFPSYLCCKRLSPYKNNPECNQAYKEELANMRECVNCQRVVSKIVLFDLTDANLESWFKSRNIFESYECFIRFQTNGISKMFLTENSTVKYNTYIIFLIKSSSTRWELVPRLIQANLDYARKLFFTYGELKEYLKYPSALGEIGEDNSRTYDMSDIIHFADNSFSTLNSRHMWKLLIDNSDEEQRELRLRKHILAAITTSQLENLYDSNSTGISEDVDDYSQKLTAKLKQDNADGLKKRIRADCRIGYIEFNNYRTRTLGSKFASYPKLMNLIFALNSSGKTSVLDGIAFAITGVDSKSANLHIIEDSVCTVKTNKFDVYGLSSQSSSDEIRKRKVLWYPTYIGCMYELFSRINYFRLEASMQFQMNKETGNSIVNDMFADTIVHKMKSRMHWLMTTLDSIKAEYCELTRSPEGDNCVQRLVEFCDNLRSDIDGILSESDFTETLQLYYTTQKKRNESSINQIYHRLHSIDENIYIEQNEQGLSNFKFSYSDKPKDKRDIHEMSAAQINSLALSVMLSQYLHNVSAPRLLLLDEPMANLDDLHLLNLLDFLRELALQGTQVFIAVARSQTADVADVKFRCLAEEYTYIDLDDSISEQDDINPLHED